jgi:hypothetical protein
MVHGFLYLARQASLTDTPRDLDSRRLADIGLVRGEDGTLRRAFDPTMVAIGAPAATTRGLIDRFRALSHLKWSLLR